MAQRLLSAARAVWALLRDAGRAWLDDRAPRLGAALAFYTVLSFAPLLIVTVGVASLVFGREQLKATLLAQMEGVVGTAGRDLVTMLLSSAFEAYSFNADLTASLIGGVMLLFGASVALAQLNAALATIFGSDEERGVGEFVAARLSSLGMVLAAGVLMLVSLLARLGRVEFSDFLATRLRLPGWGLELFDLLLSLVLVAALFAFLYRGFPSTRVQWRDVWLGSLVASLLFMLGRSLLSLVLDNSRATSAYGAAGSLVAFLLWINAAAQIFFYGAELCKVYRDRYGSCAGAREAPTAERRDT